MDFHDILIVSDFDLTYTDLNHQIVPKNSEAVLRFIEGGGCFTMGTGRSKPNFAPEFSRVPSNAPCILSNGALIYDFVAEKTIAEYAFDADEELLIRELASRFCMGKRSLDMSLESGLELYLPDHTYAINENEYTHMHYNFIKMRATHVNSLDEIPHPWLKAVFTGNPDQLHILEEAAVEIGIPGVRSMDFMVEIQSRKTDKGVASRELANILGRKILVCAGDADNDRAMLKEADIAFVPSSASKSILSMGFNVCAHANDGAVADMIDKLAAL